MLHIYNYTFLILDDALFRYICRFDVEVKDAALVGPTFVEMDCLSLSSTVLCNIFLLILLSVGFLSDFFWDLLGFYYKDI